MQSLSRLLRSRSLIEVGDACRYAQPTPIQMQAIPLMLENREILACAPTGEQKNSLCSVYNLPIFLIQSLSHIPGSLCAKNASEKFSCLLLGHL
jgi:superfamily II DNA/RNA helicase